MPESQQSVSIIGRIRIYSISLLTICSKFRIECQQEKEKYKLEWYLYKKAIDIMGTFLDNLLKKMKEAPHVGVPPVTNPKMPTKVERDTEAYAVRQKEMPDFHFGTGTKLEQLVEHMKNAPHPTPTCADPAFNGEHTPLTPEVETWEAMYQSFEKIYKEKKSKQK